MSHAKGRLCCGFCGASRVALRVATNLLFSVTDSDRLPPHPADSYGSKTVSNSQDTAEDIYSFLQLFYEKFPKFKDVDFHVSGGEASGFALFSFRRTTLLTPRLASPVYRIVRRHLPAQHRLGHPQAQQVQADSFEYLDPAQVGPDRERPHRRLHPVRVGAGLVVQPTRDAGREPVRTDL